MEFWCVFYSEILCKFVYGSGGAIADGILEKAKANKEQQGQHSITRKYPSE